MAPARRDPGTIVGLERRAMQSHTLFSALADATLILHVLVVLFVVLGLLLVIAGGIRHWRWVRDPTFRLLHLLAIGFVVAESWFGWVCPLTSLEMLLRARVGAATYSGSFIAHWLQAALYYDAPAWLFTLGYSLFGLLVLASWIAVRPRPFGRPDGVRPDAARPAAHQR